MSIKLTQLYLICQLHAGNDGLLSNCKRQQLRGSTGSSITRTPPNIKKRIEQVQRTGCASASPTCRAEQNPWQRYLKIPKMQFCKMLCEVRLLSVMMNGNAAACTSTCATGAHTCTHLHVLIQESKCLSIAYCLESQQTTSLKWTSHMWLFSNVVLWCPQERNWQFFAWMPGQLTDQRQPTEKRQKKEKSLTHLWLGGVTHGTSPKD